MLGYMLTDAVPRKRELQCDSESDLFLEGIAKGSEDCGVESCLLIDCCSFSSDESEIFLVLFAGGKGLHLI